MGYHVLQIGWIFKSKANESYCLYSSGPMVRHYALLFGFHTLPNMCVIEYSMEIMLDHKSHATEIMLVNVGPQVKCHWNYVKQ